MTIQLSRVMWGKIAFILLVVLPLLFHADEFRERIKDLWKGRSGLKYAPVAFGALFIGLLIVELLTAYIPILDVGWLGYNIIAEPLTSEGGEVSGSPGVFGILMLPVMVAAFLIFNFYEEKYFRDSWKDVGVWAGFHLVMGIPLAAPIAIFMGGIVFKKVYDRKGLEAAYATHFATNCILLGVIGLQILLA